MNSATSGSRIPSPDSPTQAAYALIVRGIDRDLVGSRARGANRANLDSAQRKNFIHRATGAGRAQGHAGMNAQVFGSGTSVPGRHAAGQSAGISASQWAQYIVPRSPPSNLTCGIPHGGFINSPRVRNTHRPDGFARAFCS